MTDDTVTVIVTDTSVLINLLHVGRVPMLSRLPGLRFVVPDEVLVEVTDADQRAMLDHAVGDGTIGRCQLDLVDGAALILELGSRLGIGELACLALAEQHGWSVACDERRFFRAETVRRLGVERLIGTPDLFLRAITAQVITVDEADADKAALEQKRFRMPFGSFRELIITSTEGSRE